MMMMMLSLLLLALLNSCLSLTLTSPPIASVTAVDGASPGAKKNTFNIAVSDTCLVTYVNGQVETTHTFIPCAQHASEVPYGCTFTDSKTLCPPEDHCAWSGATYRCDNSNCYVSSEDGGHPAYTCTGPGTPPVGDGDDGSGGLCYKTVTSSYVITSYYATVVSDPDCTGGATEPPPPPPFPTIVTTSTRTLDNGCYEIWKQSFDMVELLTTCPETVTTESPSFDNAVTTSTRVLSNGCFEVWKQSYDVIETSTWCIEPPYTPNPTRPDPSNYVTSTSTLSNGCLEIHSQAFDVIYITTSCPELITTTSESMTRSFSRTMPEECTEYEGSTYCPEYCVTYILYEGDGDYIGLGTGTLCNANGTSCEFVTAEATPSFSCT